MWWRRILADRGGQHGAGKRDPHPALSGGGRQVELDTAWLAHQLISVATAGIMRIFDSIIVITDRRVLDKTNPRDSNRAKTGPVGSSIIGAGEVVPGFPRHRAALQSSSAMAKKIIVSRGGAPSKTCSTVPGEAHRGRRSSSSADEAHSSCGGRNRRDEHGSV